MYGNCTDLTCKTYRKYGKTVKFVYLSVKTRFGENFLKNFPLINGIFKIFMMKIYFTTLNTLISHIKETHFFHIIFSNKVFQNHFMRILMNNFIECNFINSTESLQFGKDSCSCILTSTFFPIGDSCSFHLIIKFLFVLLMCFMLL